MKNRVDQCAVRKYLESDFDGLVQCALELQKHLSPMDTDSFIRPVKEFDAVSYAKLLLKDMKKAGGAVLVAYEENQVIGFAAVYIRKNSTRYHLDHYAKKVGVIEDLCVRSRKRSRGVGALLITAVESFLRKKKCELVRVNCFLPNKRAHEFYKRSGYKDRTVDLIKKI